MYFYFLDWVDLPETRPKSTLSAANTTNKDGNNIFNISLCRYCILTIIMFVYIVYVTKLMVSIFCKTTRRN